MTERPHAIDLIARRRAEGVPEREIAAELGITLKYLWKKVSRWNTAHSDDRLPPPSRAPRVSRKDCEDVARMVESGVSPAEIARRIGVSYATVYSRMRVARRRGILPEKPAKTGRAAWTLLQQKGAVPPMGHVGAIVDALSAAEIDAMLRHSDRNDKTLADTLARIVKEYLDGYTDPRR